MESGRRWLGEVRYGERPSEAGGGEVWGEAVGGRRRRGVEGGRRWLEPMVFKQQHVTCSLFGVYAHRNDHRITSLTVEGPQGTKAFLQFC